MSWGSTPAMKHDQNKLDRKDLSGLHFHYIIEGRQDRNANTAGNWRKEKMQRS